MIIDEKRSTIKKITNAFSICCERMENVLHNKLDMTKSSAQWDPRLLKADQKRPD